MTPHLSSHQISLLLIEENPAARAHIESCPACRVEFERLDDALRHFRLSAQHWSVESKPVPASHAAPGMRALAALSLFLCLFAGARIISLRGPANPPVAAGSPLSDADLLETVTHQVSQPFASPLQPLAIATE